MDDYCSCYDVGEGYGPDSDDLFQQAFFKSRKERICCECGIPIKKGEKYQSSHGRWDDRWDTFDMCETCAKIRADLTPSCCFGELKIALRECLDVELV